jgi:hypothetical protein
MARITTNRRPHDYSLIFAVFHERTLQLLSRQVCEKPRSDLQGMMFVALARMKRMLSLMFLLSLFAVPISEAAQGRSDEQENQAGGRGRGRGQTGQIAQQAVSVPEPSSLILLGSGAVAVGLWVRQNRPGRRKRDS